MSHKRIVNVLLDITKYYLLNTAKYIFFIFGSHSKSIKFKLIYNFDHYQKMSKLFRKFVNYL